jgi:hypothetical protein
MRLAVARVRVLLTMAGTLAVIGAAGGVAAAAPVSALTPATGSAGVSAGFQPISASFVSSSWGVVLGTTGCTGFHRCHAQLAQTSDGGSHWSLFHAPGFWINKGPRVVNQVTFVSKQVGYLFDQYASKVFWATTDGGAHWLAYSLSGPVNQIAAVGGHVYALGGQQLWETALGTNVWSKVAGINTGGSLAVSGSSIWVAGRSNVWIKHGTGGWVKYVVRCPRHFGLVAISAASATDVAFSCANFQGMFHTNKQVLTSTDGGRLQHAAGRQAPEAGDNAGFAVPPGRPTVFFIAVVTPGKSYLARSTNGGTSWTQLNVPHTTGGTNLSSLAFVSSTVGIVVVGGPGQLGKDGLFRTTNTGHTWNFVTF